MTQPAQPSDFYIGWDVGGWNCDRNGKSRDAVVILDRELKLIYSPWRGNLRSTLNESVGADAFITALFDLCQKTKKISKAKHCESIPDHEESLPAKVTLAIDAPLGFSQGYKALLSSRRILDPIGKGGPNNPYLFRHTEKILFGRGFKPLSAVNDMIGSQATKAMHALAKFAPDQASTGVWTDRRNLVAIETYPAACQGSMTLSELRAGFNRKFRTEHADESDALTCALVAYLFDKNKQELIPPDNTVPPDEGWIWVPTDARKA